MLIPCICQLNHNRCYFRLFESTDLWAPNDWCKYITHKLNKFDRFDAVTFFALGLFVSFCIYFLKIQKDAVAVSVFYYVGISESLNPKYISIISSKVLSTRTFNLVLFKPVLFLLFKKLYRLVDTRWKHQISISFCCLYST